MLFSILAFDQNETQGIQWWGTVRKAECWTWWAAVWGYPRGHQTLLMWEKTIYLVTNDLNVLSRIYSILIITFLPKKTCESIELLCYWEISLTKFFQFDNLRTIAIMKWFHFSDSVDKNGVINASKRRCKLVGNRLVWHRVKWWIEGICDPLNRLICGIHFSFLVWFMAKWKFCGFTRIQWMSR